MIAAQIISIVAFLISWIWWVTFIVGLICFGLLQIIWCCRQNKIGLHISAAISALAASTCIIAGIVMIVVWKNQSWCNIWNVTEIDDYYKNSKYDYCREGAWATVAFITALLWFATTGCILYFVKSGRHTKWEEKLRAADTTTAATTATTTAIEMGTVQHHHHDDYQQQQQGQQSTMGTTVPTATTTSTATDHAIACSTADSYVLPEIPNKIDDV